VTNGSTTIDYKMTDIDVWLKQVVREFWGAEFEKYPCIHERLLKMYREATADVSHVQREVRNFNPWIT
jgi:hypothetical protein